MNNWRRYLKDIDLAWNNLAAFLSGSSLMVSNFFLLIYLLILFLLINCNIFKAFEDYKMFNLTDIVLSSMMILTIYFFLCYISYHSIHIYISIYSMNSSLLAIM